MTVSGIPFSVSHAVAAVTYSSTVPKTVSASSSAELLPDPMTEATSRSRVVQVSPAATGTTRTPLA
jgi:hypothetical protein